MEMRGSENDIFAVELLVELLLDAFFDFSLLFCRFLAWDRAHLLFPGGRGAFGVFIFGVYRG